MSSRVIAPRAKRRRWTTALAWIAGVLAFTIIAATIGGLWLTHRSMPQTTGSIEATGLKSNVEVLRDQWGVPQLYADNADDLFFAQGFVHAQDRFWEMDFRRHVTAGRLSELFGKSQLKTDEFLRVSGWRRVAEAELPMLSAETQRNLASYAKRVNAYLKGKSNSQISLEYAVLGLRNLGYKIEPWTPVDSLAWLKAMAWDLRGNDADETGRSLVADKVGVQRAEQLWPGYPFDRHDPIVMAGTVVDGRYDQDALASVPAVPVSARPVLGKLDDLMKNLPHMLGEDGPGIGSNSWVVSGSRTTTGKPLLATDPHLGPMMPSIWYQMGLHCRSVSTSCPYDVAGYTFSGLPGVVIGHNADVAWGFTNVNPDVVDLYLEDVHGDTYRVGDQRRPMTVRTEQIKVAGGKTETLTIRATEHGPLVSDGSGGSSISSI